MSLTLVLGALFGDEGKGRVAHELAKSHKIVCRFNGGANAAHTIVHKQQKVVLRQVPCGLLRHKRSLVGDGMLLNLEDLADELDDLAPLGVHRQKLTISNRSHIVLSTHRAMDQHADDQAGSIGTTQMGMGPALRDKTSRTGLRIIDLEDKALVRDRLLRHAAEASAALGTTISPRALERELFDSLGRVDDLIGDTHAILKKAVQKDDAVLLEGAQGALLDIDWGAYPFVTSSHPTTGGALANLGVPPHALGDIVGVTRAYTTRQSRGPMPTEIPLEEERAFRAATADHAVRVGWLDTVLLRHACFINGFTELLVTGLDRLAGLPRVRLCTGWRINNRRTDVVPPHLAALSPQPIHEDLPGYPRFRARSYKDVPPGAKAFVDRIEELVGIPVRRVSASRAGPLLMRNT